MLNRDIASREIDQTAGNEERRNAARAFFLQDDRGLGDAAEAADPGADKNAGLDLLFIGGRLPARVGKRLRCRRDSIKDEVIDFALLFRLHPLVGVEASIAAAAARHRHRDLAGEIGDVEPFDAAGAALTRQQTAPARLDSATKRRDHAETRDNYPAHLNDLAAVLAGVAARHPTGVHWRTGPQRRRPPQKQNVESFAWLRRRLGASVPAKPH